MVEKILYGITGKNITEILTKIREFSKAGVTEVAYFPSMIPLQDRMRALEALMESNIKTIPLIHARHDMDRDEIDLYRKLFKTEFFTIHEMNWVQLPSWYGHLKHLFPVLHFLSMAAFLSIP